MNKSQAIVCPSYSALEATACTQVSLLIVARFLQLADGLPVQRYFGVSNLQLGAGSAAEDRRSQRICGCQRTVLVFFFAEKVSTETVDQKLGYLGPFLGLPFQSHLDNPACSVD